MGVLKEKRRMAKVKGSSHKKEGKEKWEDKAAHYPYSLPPSDAALPQRGLVQLNSILPPPLSSKHRDPKAKGLAADAGKWAVKNHAKWMVRQLNCLSA